MSWFSSGKKWKRRAEEQLKIANRIEDYQEDVEFRRNMLSNIRQNRIARGQLEVMNYSTTASTSSAAGALANLDSSLAGEAYYSYGTSDRMQQIQDHQQLAEKYYKKYQKQQQKRAGAFSIAGTIAGAALGAVTGGFGLGLTAGMGAAAGGSIGQGIGQIAANTGITNTMQGVQNIMTGGTQLWEADVNYKRQQEILAAITGNAAPRGGLPTPAGYTRYEAFSLDSNYKPLYNTAEQFLLYTPTGTKIKACRGYYG